MFVNMVRYFRIQEKLINSKNLNKLVRRQSTLGWIVFEMACLIIVSATFIHFLSHSHVLDECLEYYSNMFPNWLFCSYADLLWEGKLFFFFLYLHWTESSIMPLVYMTLPHRMGGATLHLSFQTASSVLFSPLHCLSFRFAAFLGSAFLQSHFCQ